MIYSFKKSRLGNFQKQTRYMAIPSMPHFNSPVLEKGVIYSTIKCRLRL